MVINPLSNTGGVASGSLSGLEEPDGKRTARRVSLAEGTLMHERETASDACTRKDSSTMESSYRIPKSSIKSMLPGSFRVDCPESLCSPDQIPAEQHVVREQSKVKITTTFSFGEEQSSFDISNSSNLLHLTEVESLPNPHSQQHPPLLPSTSSTSHTTTATVSSLDAVTSPAFGVSSPATVTSASSSQPPKQPRSLLPRFSSFSTSMVIDVDTVLRSSVDIRELLKNTAGPEFGETSTSILGHSPPTPEMFQTPQTFMDMGQQFLGSSGGSGGGSGTHRHSRAAAGPGRASLFRTDPTSSRTDDWAAPEVALCDNVAFPDILLVNGNDFKLHYAKSFFQKPHALYLGFGPVVKSVVIAVRPKFHKAIGRASLRPQDFAAVKALSDFSSKGGAATLGPPSAGRDGPSSLLDDSDDSVYVLIFSQYGTWRTVLTLEDVSPGMRRFVSRAGKSKAFPAAAVLKALLHRERPDLKLEKLSQVEASSAAFSGLSGQMLHYEERFFAKGHKFGLLYCKAGQTTEEEMFRNLHEEASPGYLRFLAMLGEMIILEGWQSYAGGLDIKKNTTGTHTVRNTICPRTLTNPDEPTLEIIFHVPTLMPFFPDDPQAVERKRHVGNDIVTVVFQDKDAPPFCPTSVRTTFTHVYIVVREVEEGRYDVGVVSRHNVPEFGPPLPSAELFEDNLIFRKWLLYKLVNAERASLYHPTFRLLMIQSRHQLLENILQSQST
ncbi:MAG: GTPase-activating protein [archaeon]|nr:GTPase-activating protein [archaeon]